MDMKERALEYFKAQAVQFNNEINAVLSPLPDLPDDISQVLGLEEWCQARYNQIHLKEVPALRFDGTAIINEEFAEAVREHLGAKEALLAEYDSKVQELQNARTNAIASATERATAGVRPLIEKHNRLMSYKDSVEDICKKYSISPTDIQISRDLTAEEYSTLLDAAIEGCQSMTKQKSAKFNPLNLLFKPLDWDGKVELQLLAIVLFCIAFRYVGGLFAIAFFASMIASTAGVYKKLDKLKIAESMMYTPDFDKFMQRDEIDAIGEIDTSELDTWRDEELAVIAERDPGPARSQALIAYANSVDAIEDIANKFTSQMKDALAKAEEKALNDLTTVTKHKNDLIAKMKCLGDGMLDEKPRCAPTRRYILGMINPVLEQRVDVPYANYVFSPMPGMLEFMKLMIANAILDIKEKHLTVSIVDPEGLGRDFAEFLQQDQILHDYIKVVTEKPDDLMSDMRRILTDNIRLCGKRTLDDVNIEAEEKEMVTRDYNIVILYSGHDSILKHDENLDILTNSYKYGVTFYIWGNLQAEGVYQFEYPFAIEGINMPHDYDFALGAKCTNAFADAVLNSKDGSIDYYSSIQEKYIPREKWGTWSTNKGIDLNFGLADGDPTKGFPMVLGDANVHLLMAGQSGAGKSAAINQMLLSLLTKYNPNELMLVMIDFKNVEFSTFTVPDERTGGKLSIIPHARIMAGTKDGEYALSIFDFLIAEMENRQKLFGAVNQKKLEDYNNLMREQGHPERALPRILLLIDEFQVMFTEVDPKIVALIQDRIRSLAKLARAFGCHMWFTSQSMSGTMSDDVKANFSMRAALRCTREVSTEIIGNPASGTIKAKFGYLYTNDSTGQDPTRNILWRVPFVSTKNILKTMNEAADLYKSQGILGYQSEFYDEDQRHSDKELFDFYADNADNEAMKNPHLLVLGRRTNFSTNNAPVNMFLEKGDFNNIIMAAVEDADMLNLCRTVIDNCTVHGIKYIISCADEDAHQLLELDTRLKGPFLKWSYPNTEFRDWIDEDKSPVVNLINKRLADPSAITAPVYVILYNWDKFPGFGVAEDRKLDVMREYIRMGPTVDVHFVLIIRTKGEIPRNMYAMFKHRIVALTDEPTSHAVLDNAKGAKLNPKGGFAIYLRGTVETKFKIYQHEFARKLADKELVLK